MLQNTQQAEIDFTRVNNDINGNPRRVCHYSNIPLSEKETTEIENIVENTKINGGNTIGLSITLNYELALKKAKTLGGKKFNNKQFGGGIVFQSYANDTDLINKINNL